MRYLTAALAVITTSLWLGGCVALALLAVAVFKGSGLDRETAGRATSAMFVWFGRYQLGVGAVALIAAFVGYVLRPKIGSGAGVTIGLFVMHALASIGAVAFNMFYIPRLEALRIGGQSKSPAFDVLHKQSEYLMTGVMAALLVAALLLPAFCRAIAAPVTRVEGDSLSD